MFYMYILSRNKSEYRSKNGTKEKFLILKYIHNSIWIDL